MAQKQITRFCKVRVGDRIADFICRDARTGMILPVLTIREMDYESFTRELDKQIKAKRDEGWEIYVEPG